MTVPFMSVGAVGVISVASNLIPKAMSDLVEACLAGDWAGARKLHAEYYGLFRAFLKLDTNPVPIKTALGLAGAIDPVVRLPMSAMRESGVAELRRSLEELKLI